MKESVDISKTYETLDLIGRGSYALVHRAINKHTGRICAIKKITINHSELSNLMEEIDILSNCRCENIVKFLASSCSNKEVWIVMEYCCGGSVKDVMKQLGRTLTAEQITVILRDVLKGLHYLHAKDKIHRDVKAANILLDQHGVAKLGDFGVSERIDPSARKLADLKGTLLWLPPEVFSQHEISFAIDIWSLGITIIEMGDGQPPYNDLERNAAFAKIKDKNLPPPSFRDPSKWSKDLVDFLSLCLDKEAARRKSAEQLLNYEIMQRAPENIIIKQLVDETCTSTINQTESSLSKKYQLLWKENGILYVIYHERKKKVIKVDQMKVSHKALAQEYEQLFNGTRRKNNEIARIREECKIMKDAIQKLERTKNELLSSLEDKKKRKMEIKDQLDKINEKQENELRLRAKLKDLES